MARGEIESPEWIDGFLFVGNHLALNFLNTKPVLEGGPREFLPDAKAFQRWLVAAGLVVPSAKSTMRSWRDSARGTRFVEELRAFRERFRAAVLAIEAGSLPPETFLKEVNGLLAKYPRQLVLVKEGYVLVRKYPFAPVTPEGFWALLAEAVVALLTDADHTRVRKCPSCVVHFLDTSKKGARRWCSMNICGNRLKVARYRRGKKNE